MPTKLTLAEKLAEAGAAIGDLVKEGDNGEFTYLRAFDVLKAVREQLFKRGIVIIPTHVLSERSQPYQTVTGDIVDEVSVRVNYYITDGNEHIEGQGAGVGQDYRGKALYMALTGSLKFFCQALGLIAGIPDDPETVNEGRIPDDLAAKLDEAEAKFGPDMREHPISQRDVRAFGAACIKAGLRNAAREKFLDETFGTKNITELRRRDAPVAIAWAVSQSKEVGPAPLTEKEVPF
jgi:hypothetical protein